MRRHAQRGGDLDLVARVRLGAVGVFVAGDEVEHLGLEPGPRDAVQGSAAREKGLSG